MLSIETGTYVWPPSCPLERAESEHIFDPVLDAEEAVATSRQYGFSARLAHALTRRGISRAKLGEIDQGIAVDDRPTAR